MKYKVTEIEADMKIEYLDQVESLEKKYDESMKSHVQFKTTSGHGLEAIKDGAEKVWNELAEAFNKADVFILKKESEIFRINILINAIGSNTRMTRNYKVCREKAEILYG